MIVNQIHRFRINPRMLLLFMVYFYILVSRAIYGQLADAAEFERLLNIVPLSEAVLPNPLFHIIDSPLSNPLGFGRINTSNLVGVGMCNNPMYLANGAWPRNIVRPNDDWTRTFVTVHAIAKYENKVFDATVGPALGTQTEEEFFNATVNCSIEREKFWYFPNNTKALIYGKPDGWINKDISISLGVPNQ